MARRKKKSKVVNSLLYSDDVSYIINELSYVFLGRTPIANILSRVANNYLSSKMPRRRNKELNMERISKQKVIHLSNGVEYYPPAKSGVSK